MKIKNKKGFTLVELIIVIVIIGILAAVLIPTFTSYSKRAALSSEKSTAKQANTFLTTALLESNYENDELDATAIKNLINSQTEGFTFSAKSGSHYWYGFQEKKIIVETIEAVNSKEGTVTNGSFSELVPGYLFLDDSGNEVSSTYNALLSSANADDFIANIDKLKKAYPYSIDSIIARNFFVFDSFTIDGEDAISSVLGKNPFISTDKQITFQKDITIIPANAVHSTKVKKVVVPSSVTHIGNSAFADSGISKVILPDSVISVGAGVFNNNPKLSLYLNSNLTIESIFNPFFIDAGSYLYFNSVKYTMEASGLSLINNSKTVILRNLELTSFNALASQIDSLDFTNPYDSYLNPKDSETIWTEESFKGTEAQLGVDFGSLHYEDLITTTTGSGLQKKYTVEFDESKWEPDGKLDGLIPWTTNPATVSLVAKITLNYNENDPRYLGYDLDGDGLYNANGYNARTSFDWTNNIINPYQGFTSTIKVGTTTNPDGLPDGLINPDGKIDGMLDLSNILNDNSVAQIETIRDTYYSWAGWEKEYFENSFSDTEYVPENENSELDFTPLYKNQYSRFFAENTGILAQFDKQTQVLNDVYQSLNSQREALANITLESNNTSVLSDIITNSKLETGVSDYAKYFLSYESGDFARVLGIVTTDTPEGTIAKNAMPNDATDVIKIKFKASKNIDDYAGDIVINCNLLGVSKLAFPDSLINSQNDLDASELVFGSVGSLPILLTFDHNDNSNVIVSLSNNSDSNKTVINSSIWNNLPYYPTDPNNSLIFTGGSEDSQIGHPYQVKDLASLDLPVGSYKLVATSGNDTAELRFKIVEGLNIQNKDSFSNSTATLTLTNAIALKDTNNPSNSTDNFLSVENGRLVNYSYYAVANGVYTSLPYQVLTLNNHVLYGNNHKISASGLASKTVAQGSDNALIVTSNSIINNVHLTTTFSDSYYRDSKDKAFSETVALLETISGVVNVYNSRFSGGKDGIRWVGDHTLNVVNNYFEKNVVGVELYTGSGSGPKTINLENNSFDPVLNGVGAGGENTLGTPIMTFPGSGGSGASRLKNITLNEKGSKVYAWASINQVRNSPASLMKGVGLKQDVPDNIFNTLQNKLIANEKAYFNYAISVFTNCLGSRSEREEVEDDFTVEQFKYASPSFEFSVVKFYLYMYEIDGSIDFENYLRTTWGTVNNAPLEYVDGNGYTNLLPVAKSYRYLPGYIIPVDYI